MQKILSSVLTAFLALYATACEPDVETQIRQYVRLLPTRLLPV